MPGSAGTTAPARPAMIDAEAMTFNKVSIGDANVSWSLDVGILKAPAQFAERSPRC
jgi:hypothetical protein